MKKTKKKKVARNNHIGKTLAVIVGSAYLVKALKGRKNKKEN